MEHPINLFVDNTNEVLNLYLIHETVTGERPGRRYNVEVLNKSCIVLLTACWEAFVEDTASIAFEFLIDNSQDNRRMPKEVRKKVASWIKGDKNELRMWDLAGEGWKSIFREHKQKVLSSFNTPKAGNVDDLYKELLGLANLSEKWHWPGMPADKARERLAEYIDLRGSIAHRVKASKKVHKRTVEHYQVFITRLAGHTSNLTSNYINELVGKRPWTLTPIGIS